MQMNKFGTFSGDLRWLSNFWYQTIEYEGIVYPSTEHAYQASKTLDLAVRQEMSNMGSAGAVMRYGRTLEVRQDWEDIKIRVMKEVNQKKFENPELRKKLLKTGNEELIEGNTWGDTFWGVCDGVGQNNLGKVLMQIRYELQDQEMTFGTHTLTFMDQIEATDVINKWVAETVKKYVSNNTHHFLTMQTYGLTLGETTYPNGGVMVLWYNSQQIGIATVVRDDKNFSVLTIVNNILR